DDNTRSAHFEALLTLYSGSTSQLILGFRIDMYYCSDKYQYEDKKGPQESSKMNALGKAIVSDLPILGIAGITFKVSDLAKALAYYQVILGLPEAFTLTDSSGGVTSVYFRVNDDQYIEVIPNLAPGELVRQARIVFQCSNVETVHAVYAARGLTPE